MRNDVRPDEMLMIMMMMVDDTDATHVCHICAFSQDNYRWHRCVSLMLLKLVTTVMMMMHDTKTSTVSEQ